MGERPVFGAVRTHVTLSDEVRCLSWVQFAASQSDCSRDVKAHRSQTSLTNAVMTKKCDTS